MRTCDAAVLVLQETNNPAVMWGDEHLLHLIAERAGLRTAHRAFNTGPAVLANLSKCPGILVAGFTRCGGHERLVRIFRLPDDQTRPCLRGELI